MAQISYTFKVKKGLRTYFKQSVPKFLNPNNIKYCCNRFASSKSGKIYLHTDIRMIIFRKSDLDTATEHSAPPGKGYELRSFTTGPTNPKFSPRK